jgi:DNA-binding Lrp family transcriptional regulator
VLREAFDYPYRQIADIIQVSEAAVRQLVSRARKHLVSQRRAPVTSAEQRSLLTAFVAAARTGDLTVLEAGPRTHGQAAVLLRRDGEVFAVLTVNASEQGIDHVLWMMNPAKLTAVSATA